MVSKLKRYLRSVVRNFHDELDIKSLRIAALRDLPEDQRSVVDALYAAAGELTFDRMLRDALRHHQEQPTIPGLLDAYGDMAGHWQRRETMSFDQWLAALANLDGAARKQAERHALRRLALEEWGRQRFGEEEIASRAHEADQRESDERIARAFGRIH